MVFGGTMGFVGLIIGVPAFAVIYTWIKNWITRRMQKKHMPTETVAYSMQGCFRPMTEEEKIAVDKWKVNGRRKLSEKQPSKLCDNESKMVEKQKI